jgi:hypothetical protein
MQHEFLSISRNRFGDDPNLVRILQYMNITTKRQISPIACEVTPPNPFVGAKIP